MIIGQTYEILDADVIDEINRLFDSFDDPAAIIKIEGDLTDTRRSLVLLIGGIEKDRVPIKTNKEMM